jgi:predicted transporter
MLLDALIKGFGRPSTVNIVHSRFNAAGEVQAALKAWMTTQVGRHMLQHLVIFQLECTDVRDVLLSLVLINAGYLRGGEWCRIRVGVRRHPPFFVAMQCKLLICAALNSGSSLEARNCPLEIVRTGTHDWAAIRPSHRYE